MNGHINETAPPLVPIGEVKLVQVQIVVWFVRTCEVWIPFVLTFFYELFLLLRPNIRPQVLELGGFSEHFFCLFFSSA